VTPEPRKPGAAFWAALLLVLAPVVWVIGFGPAVWLTAAGCLDREVVEHAYRPILSAAVNGPETIQGVIAWWGSLGIGRGRGASFDIGNPDWWLSFWGSAGPGGARMGFEPFPRIPRLRMSPARIHLYE